LYIRNIMVVNSTEEKVGSIIIQKKKKEPQDVNCNIRVDNNHEEKDGSVIVQKKNKGRQ